MFSRTKLSQQEEQESGNRDTRGLLTGRSKLPDMVSSGTQTVHGARGLCVEPGRNYLVVPTISFAIYPLRPYLDQACHLARRNSLSQVATGALQPP